MSTKQQDFLRQLKDPVEWAVLQAFEDIERLFPFVNYTNIYALNNGLVTDKAYKLHGIDRVWHVDVGIDIDKRRAWFTHDGSNATFARRVLELINYRIPITHFRTSGYSVKEQNITAMFFT